MRRAQNALDLAKDLLRRAEYPAAETEARRALRYDTKYAEAHNLLGLIYSYRAHANVQLLEWDACLKGPARDTLRAEADELMRQADKELEKAVKLDPSYGEAWQNRTANALYFHDWERAVKHGKQALAHLGRLDIGSEPLARANLGWAYYKKQDYAHAVAELLQAVQASPRYFCLGNFRLATVFYEQQDFTEALSRLRPLIEEEKTCPPFQEAQYLGGKTYLRLHDPDSAARAFTACIDIAPKSCQARECKEALAELTP